MTWYGTFALHDIRLEKTGEKSPDAVLFGRYADDEIVVWTSSGHFDATHEGAAQANLRFAGLTDLYSFDQFASLMHAPGLAELVLKGTYKDSSIEHRIPPTIIANIRANGDRIRISVQQRSGRPLSRLFVYEDGLRTEERTVKGDTAIEIDKPRLAGVRYVTVVGIDDDGLASQPLQAEIGPAPTKRSLKVLGIGVDNYLDKRLPRLAFAKSDVDRVIGAVTTSKSQVYGRVEASKLYDAAATRAAVLTGLKRILEEGNADTDVMLVFAGHGLKASDGGYYLALTETNTADLRPTSVDWRELADLITLSRSRVTIVLDSCHSGEAGKGLFATNDAIASQLVANTGGNVVVLAGAKGREYSIELNELSGGIFSTALSRALTNAGGATNSNRNGIIEATEVYASVRRYVTEKSRGQQTPWIARNKMIGDFAWF